MGMSPGASLVFGIDITDVIWPDEFDDLVERMDVTEACIEFLAHKDGFSGDCPAEYLAESRNLTVVQCEYGTQDYRLVLAVSSSEFSASGWGNVRRLNIEQPTDADLENLRWALDAMDISPSVPDPAWMMFSSFS